MKNNTHSKGFTLIELLVVIAIIGVLSSIILVSLNTARAKARDAVRKQELTELRNALEIYYAKNGSYPNTNGIWFTSNPGGDSNGQYSDNSGNNPNQVPENWIPGLVDSGAIGSLPQDPLSGGGLSTTIEACHYYGWHHAYLYKSYDGTSYKLLSHCGPEGTMLSNDTFYDPARFNWAWMVTNNFIKPPGSTDQACAPGYDTNPNYPICW